MKRKVITVILSILFVPIILMMLLMIFGKGNLVLPVEKKAAFELSGENVSYAQKLSVKDGIIIDENENPVVLQGLMVPEVAKLNQERNFFKGFFEEVFNCGGNVIRIPVHPEYWEQDEFYLWRYLDPIVQWAVESNKYVILDLHFIGNIENGLGDEMPKIQAEVLCTQTQCLYFFIILT